MSIVIAGPGWVEEQRRNLTALAAGLPEAGAGEPSMFPSLTDIRDLIDNFDQERMRAYFLSEERGEFTGQLWEILTTSIQTLVSVRQFTRLHPREFASTTDTILQRFTELARIVLLSRPDLNLTLPPELEEIVWTIRLSPFAYLRAMANLFWSAIRHPLSETTIDLSTGRVLYRT